MGLEDSVVTRSGQVRESTGMREQRHGREGRWAHKREQRKRGGGLER